MLLDIKAYKQATDLALTNVSMYQPTTVQNALSQGNPASQLPMCSGTMERASVRVRERSRATQAFRSGRTSGALKERVTRS